MSLRGLPNSVSIQSFIKSTVEPKIPQVKDDVFGNVPAEYTLKTDVEAFFLGRLENANQPEYFSYQFLSFR